MSKFFLLQVELHCFIDPKSENSSKLTIQNEYIIIHVNRVKILPLVFSFRDLAAEQEATQKASMIAYFSKKNQLERLIVQRELQKQKLLDRKAQRLQVGRGHGFSCVSGL